MKKTKLKNLIEEEVKRIFEDLGNIIEQSAMDRSPFANYPQAMEALSAELKNLSDVAQAADRIIAQHTLDAVTDRALKGGVREQNTDDDEDRPGEEEVDNPSQTVGYGVVDADEDPEDIPDGPDKVKAQIREFFYQAGPLATSMAKIVKSFNTFAVNFELLGAKSGRVALIETDPQTAGPMMSPEGMRVTGYDPPAVPTRPDVPQNVKRFIQKQRDQK